MVVAVGSAAAAIANATVAASAVNDMTPRTTARSSPAIHTASPVSTGTRTRATSTGQPRNDPMPSVMSAWRWR